MLTHTIEASELIFHRAHQRILNRRLPFHWTTVAAQRHHGWSQTGSVCISKPPGEDTEPQPASDAVSPVRWMCHLCPKSMNLFYVFIYIKKNKSMMEAVMSVVGYLSGIVDGWMEKGVSLFKRCVWDHFIDDVAIIWYHSSGVYQHEWRRLI